MLRQDWKFQYIAKDLAKAAATKRDHHAARLDWWNKQQESVIAEVREKGLEVSETLAMQYGSTAPAVFRGKSPAGAQIIVKDEYQSKLNECASKIHQHTEKAKEYDGWVQVLEANPSKALELDIGDYLFFFGE